MDVTSAIANASTSMAAATASNQASISMLKKGLDASLSVNEGILSAVPPSPSPDGKGRLIDFRA